MSLMHIGFVCPQEAQQLFVRIKHTVARRDVEENASFMHIVNPFHTFVFCACQDSIDFYSNETLSSAYPAGGPALEPALMAGPFLHKVWRNIGHLVLTSTGTWAHQRTSWECCASCTSRQRCNPSTSIFPHTCYYCPNFLQFYRKNM